MDKVNEFLKHNFKERRVYGELIAEKTRRLTCKDGFTVSVQASKFHYCVPRKNKAWPYHSVELEFPSELDDLIKNYANECDTTDTIFPYVPIEIVNKLIEKHGGIAE